MQILLHRKFKKEYKGLPRHIKVLAENKINIFKKNPFDPRLKTHRLKGKLSWLWSFYVDRNRYRIAFEILNENIVRFYTVGTHDDVYE